LKKKEWTFLTNHGRILAYIAKHPQHTTQETAQKAGLSIRSIQQIITDLEEGGYIARHKAGRCNRYTIHPELPMRHRLERDHAIGEILLALGCKPSQINEQESDQA
jgi:predicted transcriptional regulator